MVLFCAAIKRDFLAMTTSRVQLGSTCIDASTHSSKLVSPVPPSFHDIYSLSVSSLERKARSIFIFFVLWSIYQSSFLVHFKNGPECLTKGTDQ